MSRFRFVAEEAAQFPVSLLCRVVGVTRQGFYAWKRRHPSRRELADRELSKRIREVHGETEGIYGAPRIHAELRLEHGVRVGRKRVARWWSSRQEDDRCGRERLPPSRLGNRARDRLHRSRTACDHLPTQ